MTELESAIQAAKAGLGQGAAGNFSLEYLSVAGRRFGNIPEWEARLLVDGKGAATYFRRRGPGDSAEFPPGLFAGGIPREELSSFLDQLSKSGIGELEFDAPGPRDPVNLIRLILAGKCFEFTWGSSRRPVPEAFNQLKDILRSWTLNACPSARWSLTMRIGLFQFQGGKVSSRVSIENSGSQSIWVAKPASPGFGTAFGLFLKYGEALVIREGFTPVPSKPKVAAVQQPALPVAEFVEIAPGNPLLLDFSAPLEDEAANGWAGKFVFQHYLPGDSVAGLPVFNGALFTEEMKW